MTRIIAAFAVLSTLLSGCTHNNGDIGPWFGIWTLTSIEADGAPIADYVPNSIFWKFQSTVINITQLLDHHDCRDTFGTWRQAGDSQLELNFTHSDDTLHPGTELYAPPEILHLPSDICTLHIVRFTDKHIILTYISTDGVTYKYTLVK